MVFGGELAHLAVYVAQQLGIMLGVGAGTVLLVVYLISLHSKGTLPKHERFVRAVRIAQGVGLVAIVLSGIAAIVLHILDSDTGALVEPAFIFKWVLIGVVAAGYVAARYLSLRRDVLEGFVGGNWYALFLVHMLAPVISWENLLIMYAAWMVLFGALWAACVFAMHRGAPKPAVAAAPPTPTPPSTPAPEPQSSTPPAPVSVPPVEPLPVATPKPSVTPKPSLLTRLSAAYQKAVTKAAALKVPKALPPHVVDPKSLPVPAHVAIAAPTAPVAVAVDPKVEAPTPVPAPVVPKVEPPAPPLVPPPTPPKPAEPSVPTATSAPAMTDLDQLPGLPAIRIMPRSAEELNKEHRAAVVDLTPDPNTQ